MLTGIALILLGVYVQMPHDVSIVMYVFGSLSILIGLLKGGASLKD